MFVEWKTKMRCGSHIKTVATLLFEKRDGIWSLIGSSHTMKVAYVQKARWKLVENRSIHTLYKFPNRWSAGAMCSHGTNNLHFPRLSSISARGTIYRTICRIASSDASHTQTAVAASKRFANNTIGLEDRKNWRPIVEQFEDDTASYPSWYHTEITIAIRPIEFIFGTIRVQLSTLIVLEENINRIILL